jgi:hypothetical protein
MQVTWIIKNKNKTHFQGAFCGQKVVEQSLILVHAEQGSASNFFVQKLSSESKDAFKNIRQGFLFLSLFCHYMAAS